MSYRQMQLAADDSTFGAIIAAFEAISNRNVTNELPRNITPSMLIVIRNLDSAEGEAVVAVADGATSAVMENLSTVKRTALYSAVSHTPSRQRSTSPFEKFVEF